jgi:uncharacterized membrane protein
VKYTPPPWTFVWGKADPYAGEGELRGVYANIRGGDNERIATVWEHATRIEGEWLTLVDDCANAHLIAAAPELYEACKALLEARTFCGIPFSSVDQQAIDAIRKAKGKSEESP